MVNSKPFFPTTPHRFIPKKGEVAAGVEEIPQSQYDWTTPSPKPRRRDRAGEAPPRQGKHKDMRTAELNVNRSQDETKECAMTWLQGKGESLKEHQQVIQPHHEVGESCHVSLASRLVPSLSTDLFHLSSYTYGSSKETRENLSVPGQSPS